MSSPKILASANSRLPALAGPITPITGFLVDWRIGCFTNRTSRGKCISYRLLGSGIYTQGGGLVARLSQQLRREVYAAWLTSGVSPQRFQPVRATTIVFVDFVADRILFVEVLMVFLGRIEL